MSSRAVRCPPLRLSHRPKLARPPQLASPCRSLTVEGSSDAHVRLLPPSQSLQHRIQLAIGRASRLDAIRSAFIPPGKAYLQPEKLPALNDPKHASAIPPDQRKFIRQQLQRCKYRADYVNLVASILEQPDVNARFKYEAVRFVCDFLYKRLLNGSHRDAGPTMLILAHHIRYKLEDAFVPLPQELVYVGLLCAAVSHSVPALKLFLHEHRKLDCPMSPLVFARIIDGINKFVPKTFSRPWECKEPLNEDHASSVMLGFLDAPVDAPYDLSCFVSRDSWACMDRWLRALARYKFLPQLRVEWALWLDNPLRASPESCVCPVNIPNAKAEIINSDREAMLRLNEAGNWNTKTRGDLAFVEAFRRSGAIEDAWMVLKEADFSIDLLKRRTQTALLALPELAPPELWTDEMRTLMLQNYATELAKIEKVYGVEWFWDEQTGAGYHRISGESFLSSFDNTDEGSVTAGDPGR